MGASRGAPLRATTAGIQTISLPIEVAFVVISDPRGSGKGHVPMAMCIIFVAVGVFAISELGY
jgi:hypothetical protein